MSELISLNRNDFLKGGIIFVGSTVLAYIKTILETGTFVIEPKQLLSISLIATITYLLKNVATNEQGQLGPVK